jgi:hypothetical protein
MESESSFEKFDDYSQSQNQQREVDIEYVEFYRSTTVGAALIETLNEMIEAGDISEAAANEVLLNYESSFLEVLKEELSKTVVPPVKIEVTLFNIVIPFPPYIFDREELLVTITCIGIGGLTPKMLEPLLEQRVYKYHIYDYFSRLTSSNTSKTEPRENVGTNV